MYQPILSVSLIAKVNCFTTFYSSNIILLKLRGLSLNISIIEVSLTLSVCLNSNDQWSTFWVALMLDKTCKTTFHTTCSEWEMNNKIFKLQLWRWFLFWIIIFQVCVFLALLDPGQSVPKPEIAQLGKSKVAKRQLDSYGSPQAAPSSVDSYGSPKAPPQTCDMQVNNNSNSNEI